MPNLSALKKENNITSRRNKKSNLSKKRDEENKEKDKIPFFMTFLHGKSGNKPTRRMNKKSDRDKRDEDIWFSYYSRYGFEDDDDDY